MLRFNLRIKLISVVIITTSLIFGAFLVFNNHQLKDISEKQAIQLTEALSQRYAVTCKNYIDIDVGFTTALTAASQGFEQLNDKFRDSLFHSLYSRMVLTNPKYVAIWGTFEYQYTIPGYPHDYGRKSILAVNNNDGTATIVESIRDVDGHNTEGPYFKIRQKNEPITLGEPYYDYSVSKNLITTIASPLRVNGKWAGQVGIDLKLDHMQEFIDSLDLIDGAVAMAISNTGIILGHTDSSHVGDSISNLVSLYNFDDRIADTIKAGKQKGFVHEYNEQPYSTSIVPFYASGVKTPWALTISLPVNPFLEETQKKGRKILWIGLIGMIIIFVFVYLQASQIVRPLANTIRVFKELSVGNINRNLKLNIKTRDELEEMSNTVNSLIDNMQKTESFAQEIERGNLDAVFETLGEKDRLGNALLQMRKGLKDSKERDENRRVEDQRRNWALDGLAQFADLLRVDSSNFDEYMRNLISNLVNYTNSNQGGIYLINNNDESKKTVELAGSYAFDGEKLNKKVLEYGEGLIGVSIMEAKTTHMTNLPENYLSISSGLGQNPPGSLIIAPLKHNEEVIGAIELASFSEYEEYKVKFIEDVAESIAVTIESLKIQQKSNLLLEQTQQQAEEMMAQEEELRQNMEEMMATQEENSRMLDELQEELKAKKEELTKLKKQ